MSFENIELAWLLLFLPMLLALVWWRLRTRKRRLLAFSDQKLFVSIYPNYHRDAKSAMAQAVATVAIGALLIVATLRPQWGYVWKESNKRGVDIVIAVDVSESMLAEDVSPNRLDRSRFEIYDLLDHLRGDRIALVAFAGAAFIESPLTVDYGTFRSFLKALHPEMIPLQGTNIEAALSKSIDAFGLEKDKTPAKRARAIVLITDGESFDGDVTVASKKAEELNIRIYVLGIGTEVGAPIPQAGGYKKDRSGNIIVTKLKPQVLEDLAKKTKGIFVQAITSEVDTKTIYDQGIKSVLEDAGLKGERAKRWNEYYQVPLLLALLVMLLQATSAWLLRRQTKQLGKREETSLSLLTLSLLSPLFFFPLFFFSQSASAQVAESLGENAKRAYDQGAYDHALEDFNQGAIKRPDDYRFGLGQGSSYYRLQKYSEATNSFLEAADKAKDPVEKARALYNAGNSLVQEQRLEDAIKTYEDSLHHKPNDKEALENLAYAKRLLEQEKKDQQEKNQDQEQNKKEQKEQKEQKEKDSNSQQQAQEESSANQDQQKQQEQQSKSDQNSTQQQEKQEQERQEQQEQQQQSKNDPSDKKPQSPQNTPKPEQQEKEKEQEKEQEKEGTSQTKPDQKQNPDQAAQDLASSLLDNVEENKKAFIEYRKDKALEELKAMQLDLPENDW